MKTPKFTKLLPIALALLLTTSGAYAATEATNSSQNAEYILNLAEFFDIEVTPPTGPSTTSFSGNYTAINIDTPLVGSFQVISNTNTKDVYLYGTCEAGGAQPALYGDADNLKLVFTNQDDAAESTAVEAIRTGSQDPDASPNAIAFNLTVATEHSGGPTNALLSKSFDDDKNMHYSIENGKAIFTCTVQGSAQDSSFSTRDTDGTYKATIYMSDTAL